MRELILVRTFSCGSWFKSVLWFEVIERKKEVTVVKSQKYWIAPDCDVVVVGRCHVATVIEQPERFGLARADVEAEYRRFGEPLGLEGKARMAVLIRLFGAGWVRVRHHPVSDVWVFQLDPAGWESAKARVAAFLTAAAEAGVAGRWADAALLLTGPDGATRACSSAVSAEGGTLPEKWTRLSERLPGEVTGLIYLGGG